MSYQNRHQKHKGKKKIIKGMYYNAGFLNGPKKSSLLKEIESYYPIWEERFSKTNPPPEGDTWRPLLRPVYWLGNWQFACLGYYHPPKDIVHRCVKAEAFPPFMQSLVNEIEAMTKRLARDEVPKQWKLNTCLINYYGSAIDENGKETDVARVGDHKDAELGPVASISLGERAFFQFTKGRPNDRNNVVHEQWLVDGSLLLFWSKQFKDELFHRVQRVENKNKSYFEDHVENYNTRRINLTFRYVPEKHIHDLKDIPKDKREDIQTYLETLATTSSYFKSLLN